LFYPEGTSDYFFDDFKLKLKNTDYSIHFVYLEGKLNGPLGS